MATAKKTVKRTDAAADSFSAEEKAAMKERARELKRNASAAEDEQAVLEKIASMPASDRAMGERFHAIVKAAAPHLMPKLWYGMPAYYKDGKNVCFFQDAAKFKARYATFGFNEAAKLDDGNMWPTSYALVKLTAEDEKRISALVKQAAS
ncbi:MAG TPA: DUF1801 domain-containing protein [Devosia sp.]|jgi:uncharacterized protein YdhG (YjbR/CyaY superfamily)|uniref:iron chaperone n=1 Tax=Devosia sp. TaxID=1871048 RepID=UPI002DDCC3A3|nr:DUF1801 domain-containing protein [Devosia sp.]HEV2514702.1 DUF1801 domain-containing protein [Devosia sp.]